MSVGLPEVSGISGGRSAKSAYLVIGVALIGTLMFLSFGRDNPIRPAGPVPMQLQSLVERIVASSGGQVSPDGCTMMGNINLGVTCKVQGVRNNTLREALLKDGWQLTSGPPLAAEDHGAFVRGDEYMSFDGSPERGVLLVSARKRKP